MLSLLDTQKEVSNKSQVFLICTPEKSDWATLFSCDRRARRPSSRGPRIPTARPITSLSSYDLDRRSWFSAGFPHGLASGRLEPSTVHPAPSESPPHARTAASAQRTHASARANRRPRPVAVAQRLAISLTAVTNMALFRLLFYDFSDRMTSQTMELTSLSSKSI